MISRQKFAGEPVIDANIVRFPKLRLYSTFEHIVAKQHGGLTRLDNLALACWQCNLKKGPNLSGVDPETGQITELCHPRIQTWSEHFAFRELKSKGKIEMAGLTPVGRATVRVIELNDEFRQALRYEIYRSAS